MSTSAKSATPIQNRQLLPASSDLWAYLTDRKQMLSFRDMLRELNEDFQKDFRWIAERTWRGCTRYGWFQQASKGGHLLAKPQIRPRLIDFNEVRALLITVRELDQSRAARATAQQLDEFLVKRAEADQILVNLILKHERRQRKKA